MNKYTLTDHPYLYLGSLAEAKRSQELGLWRASHQCNITCKKAIEDAIRGGFDGMNLDPACDRNIDFIVESHPAVLDGFVTLFRRALDDLHLFDQTQCISLAGQELEGKVLVLSLTALKESCWSPQNQLWLAGSGFGCHPNASGSAVYATCLGDGEHTRWNRSDFLGILKDEYLPEWARASLEQLCQKRALGKEGA